MKTWWIWIILGCSCSVVKAQPFDTLLARFDRIDELFPLADSTFILVGTNDTIHIERIDQDAQVIWSLPLISFRYDYFRYARYHLNEGDSAIQVITYEYDCDAIGGNTYRSFTIDFSGKLLDKQKVVLNDYDRGITLLSSKPALPRLGYIQDSLVVLVGANRDTTHLRMQWLSGDTANLDLLGKPVLMSMCPEGGLIVYHGFLASFFEIENGRFELTKQNSFRIAQRLYCVDEDHYISIDKDELFLWTHDDYFPLRAIGLGAEYFIKVDWNQNKLTLYSSDFNEDQDSLLIFNEKLDLIFKQAGFAFGIIDFARGLRYSCGGGNTWHDGGHLISKDLITSEGPVYTDVELIDFEIGPFTETFTDYIFGFTHLYTIPNATVTVRNNGADKLNEVTVIYGVTDTWCSDTIWKRVFYDLGLQPGETINLDVHDIWLARDHPRYDEWRYCISVQSPNQKIDDYYDDNVLCKQIELVPLAPVPNRNPVRHRQPVIDNKLAFIGPFLTHFTLDIYSLNGTQVLKTEGDTYTGFSINLESLVPGLYILQYTIPATGQVYAEKMIKPY